jgi:hypothetical protein
MEAVVEGLGAMRTDQLHIWELLAQALFSFDELTIFLKEKGIMDDSDADDLKNIISDYSSSLRTLWTYHCQVGLIDNSSPE